ncbi:C40 family peptidase [Oceanihabitans sediminis]|uniref:NlpC/P60 family protein n=1 Tax=Oceanihabitans sediminis TaxID=1812012 RepID=A0A368P798_9FLAO|nr:C40 family peptidase [Oceanihabitans sediminis]MDX1278184.1 C40 family peptidase [Oceanihabitans sediminis]MDX1773927.1 C40 family peptidase [Oceanihabitans sediminis]RBP32047.1 cell wall-associated NlpC family hydrolase [Oceanihabitans sediminis]RCU58702.1 NlpC/P60 family protein [Oceanihabitans sediminis]
MRKITLIFILLISFAACKSSKNKRIVTTKQQTNKTVLNTNTPNPKVSTPEIGTNKPISSTTKTTISNIIDNAKSFEGTRYKYGGTTKKGMDCSGLIYTSFKKEDINMPRTTTDLSTTGDWIDIKNIQVGDLVFFATSKGSRKINHVGIVTTSRTGYVEFIHASTSRGVMISNLAERYWYLAYVQARRVL